MAALIVQRPSPESDTRPANFVSAGSWIRAAACEIEQPGSDHAAAAPDLGDVRQVEIVLIVLGIAQRRGFRIDHAGLLADIGGLENRQPFGIGRHHAVFDAVVHHLDEMAGAVRPAMQIALLGRAAAPFRGPGCAGCRRGPAQAWRRSDRGASPHRLRRRSSCNSRAPGPRRRRWCRHRHSGCPLGFSSLARRMSSM